MNVAKVNTHKGALRHVFYVRCSQYNSYSHVYDEQHNMVIVLIQTVYAGVKVSVFLQY